MSQQPPTPLATAEIDQPLATIRAGLAEPSRRGAVVVTLRGDPRTVAAFADRIAVALGRPLHRLAPEDAVLAREQRAVALLRLLDTSDVTGAVVLVDAADQLRLGRTAEATVRRRVGEIDDRVVLLGVEHDADGATAVGGHPLVVVDVLPEDPSDR